MLKGVSVILDNPMENLASQRPPLVARRQIEPTTVIRDIFDSLRRHRVITALCVALGIAAAAALSLIPRSYKAEGSIRLQPGAEDMYSVSPEKLLLGSGDADDKINTEVAIIKSRTLLLKVAKDLNLPNNPAFWKYANRHYSLSDPTARELVFEQLLSKLKVEHVLKSQMVTIDCTTVNPQLSANIANTLMNDYISNELIVRYGSTNRVSTWLIGQLGDLKDQVEKDQEALVTLQNELGMVTFDEKGQGQSQYSLAMETLTRSASEATIARIIADARYRFIQTADPSLLDSEQPLLPTGGSQASLLAGLRISQSAAQQQYAQLTAKFGASYPEVKQAKAQLDAINRQVNAEEARILNQAKLSYQAATANEQMTNNALDQKRAEALKSRDNIVRYSLMLHEYESHRILYEGLVQRLREAGINAGLQSANVDIVDLADIETIPQPPGPIILGVLAVVAFFIVGILLSMVIDHFDTRIDTTEQAEDFLGIAALTTLPLIGDAAAANPLPILVDSRSPYSEGIQLMRTSALLWNIDRPAKVILLTSALDGEGKSMTTRNFAASLCQEGKTVLIIDGDFRRPTQNLRLGISLLPGLSSVLSGSAKLEEAITVTKQMSNLYLLPAGAAPPQPGTMLGSVRMHDLVAQCRERFDYVIVDTPPALLVSDAMAAASLADGIILIVRQHRADRRAVLKALGFIRKADIPIIGFVLNGVEARWSKYSEYYGKYYGKSGYYNNDEVK
jgi:succinoglycan biosynthesis transport protein ExoP